MWSRKQQTTTDIKHQSSPFSCFSFDPFIRFWQHIWVKLDPKQQLSVCLRRVTLALIGFCHLCIKTKTKKTPSRESANNQHLHSRHIHDLIITKTCLKYWLHIQQRDGLCMQSHNLTISAGLHVNILNAWILYNIIQYIWQNKQQSYCFPQCNPLNFTFHLCVYEISAMASFSWLIYLIDMPKIYIFYMQWWSGYLLCPWLTWQKTSSILYSLAHQADLQEVSIMKNWCTSSMTPDLGSVMCLAANGPSAFVKQSKLIRGRYQLWNTHFFVWRQTCLNLFLLLHYIYCELWKIHFFLTSNALETT